MKNFRLVKKLSEQQRRDLLDEIETANLWLVDQRRQGQIVVQRETQWIPLRLQVAEAGVAIWYWQQTQDHENIHRFPLLGRFVSEFAASENSTPGVMIIARLRPFGQVYPHHDHGPYYQLRDRFHLVLHSPDGSDMVSGDEACTLREGELWWFNNSLRHQAFNHSFEWRTHLIFDLNTTNYKK